MAGMAARIRALDDAECAPAPVPVAEALRRAAGQLRLLQQTMRGVEDAVGHLSAAAPTVAMRLPRLQDVDRSIQSLEALADYLDRLADADGTLGEVDHGPALAVVRLGAVAAALAGEAEIPGQIEGFELL